MKTLLSLFFVLGVVSLNAQVFNTSPGDSIPDDGTTECWDINVAGVGTIDDTYGLATVCLNINHGWVGELEITLTSPGGTTFNLTEVDFGVWGATGFVNTCFEQDAGQVLDGGTDPYTGTFIPIGSMYSVNDGQNADGTWQLCISDAFTSQKGFLDSWSIEFNNNPAVQPPLGNQDCAAAIPVCNSTFSEVNSYAGTGAIPEEIDGLNSCLSGEVNSVWYTFNVESDGQVNFTITPNDLTDDYDWAIYDISTANCSDIYTDPALEVSCNFSGVSGVTGANGGTGAQEEPLLNATQGQVYAVVISNWSGSTNGYTLDFTQSTSQIFDTTEPRLDSIVSVMTCGMDTLTFAFSENVICSTVTHHDLTLTGPGGPYTISNMRGDACTQGGIYERAYTFDVSPPLTINGTYTLAVAAGAAVEDNCGNLIDLAGSVDFGLVPMTITKDSTMITCFGDNNGSATITGASGQSPLTYVWNDPSAQTGATASNLGPGSYDVTVTDAVGCVQAETVEITEPTQLLVTAPDAAQSCFGVCDAISTAIASGGTSATGSYVYAWNDTGFTLGATVNSLCMGTYQVTVTDDNLCSSSATINVTEPASMIIDTTVVQSTCNQATGSIQLTITGGTPNYNYQWTNGAGATIGGNADNVSGLVSDTYSVTVTDASGCSVSETIPVTSLYEHTISATLVSDVSCFGDCDGEVTTSITGFGTIFTYSWVDQSTGVNLGITADNANTLCAGTYEITSTESTTGCFDTAVITVNSPAQMQMTTSTDTTICENGCADLSVSTAGGALPITHIWTVDFASYDLGDNVTYCPNNQTTYYVVASDANSCLEIDSVTVSKYNPLTVSISANSSSICEGDSVVLTANAAGGLAPYTYDWDGTPTSSNQFIAYPQASTNFSVNMTDNCESNLSSDNINITVNTLPNLNLTPHNEGCAPHPMQFTSNIVPAPASYTIRFGDGIDTSFASFTDTISHLYSEAGSYDVYMNVLTNEGCLADTIFENLLIVHENPIASFYVSQDTVSDVFREICFFDQSSNGDILSWVIDSTHLSTDDVTCYKGQGIGCYNATLYTSNSLGCIDSLTRQLCIEEQSSLFVPNAFTPNEDSHNSCFRPIVRGSISGTYVLQVFDRWGNLIHESKSIHDCWDGKINGQPPVIGVYVYKLWYTDNQGELIKKIGHVTVLP